MMRFTVVNTNSIDKGRVIYCPKEYSFDFEHEKTPSIHGFSSIQLGYLQLEIDGDGKALYVWGYCPYHNWRSIELAPPSASLGDLIVDLGHEIIPGVSVRLERKGNWPGFVDLRNGWVCIGDQSLSSTNKAVEFVTNTIAIVEANCLRSLWLHPEQLPDFSKI